VAKDVPHQGHQQDKEIRLQEHLDESKDARNDADLSHSNSNIIKGHKESKGIESQVSSISRSCENQDIESLQESHKIPLKHLVSQQPIHINQISISNDAENDPSTGVGVSKVSSLFKASNMTVQTDNGGNSVLTSTLSSTAFTSFSTSTTKRSRKSVFFNEQSRSSYDDMEGRNVEDTRVVRGSNPSKDTNILPCL